MSASRTPRRSAVVRDSAAPYSSKKTALPRTIETRSRTIAAAQRSVAASAGVAATADPAKAKHTSPEPTRCAKPHSRKDSLASCKASLEASEASLAACQASLVAALAEVESLTAIQNRSEKREEDATACDICYMPMFKPRILDCGHLLCEGCLVLLYHSQPKGLLECPTCRWTIKDDRVPPVCFQVKAHVDAWAMANDVAPSQVDDSAFVWPPEPLPASAQAVSDSEDAAGTSESGIMPFDEPRTPPRRPTVITYARRRNRTHVV